VTGADQHKLNENQSVRNNGCELEGQTTPFWCRGFEPSKKREFFAGRGVFFLTRPLMGDPHPIYFFTSVIYYLKVEGVPVKKKNE
jgi:hypothetical protein